MAENSKRIARRRGGGRPFKPGHSGNPGGRPKQAKNVTALARQRTVDAIATLVDVMLHGKNESARVRSAEVLLMRAWGPPTQETESPDGHVQITVRYENDWRAKLSDATPLPALAAPETFREETAGEAADP